MIMNGGVLRVSHEASRAELEAAVEQANKDHAIALVARETALRAEAAAEVEQHSRNRKNCFQ